ncbi:MAG: FAD-dependent oxidoreductase [Beijerinckiaceae bacterium]|nr:FAD-dependent oxidoreductase [Beijerinckiaceae bacterium]
MAEIRMMERTPFDVETGILVIGAGAGGLVTALRARAAGADVLVLERDPLPRGSTALSAGLIPAAGTRFQAAFGIQDSTALFAADIRRKAKEKGDSRRVDTAVAAIGPALEWLADEHGLPFSVIDNFTYPGHSAYRMHGLPSRSGAELMDRLREAAEKAGVDIVTEARAETLLVERGSNHILGVEIVRPDGTRDQVGCHALVLACNGYGGNRALVAEHIPGLKDALYFGHPGNQGEAVLWGRQLGARLVDLAGHQGHGSVAEPHGILLTWATMTEGGFQVNIRGERFSDESRGYSEQAAAVLAQPERLAYSIFDTRIAGIARQFEDFRNIEAAGALIEAPDLAALARRLGLSEAALAATAAAIDAARHSGQPDAQGRIWKDVIPLAAPFCAVKITGALFHTQGGLGIDAEARVLAEDGTPFPNLFAVGGAAAGVSGPEASGYLSGNGLLTAVAFGYLAGDAASRLAL